MTTREKIIVCLMVLAVVYGVYTLFFAEPREQVVFKSGGDKELEALNKFVNKVAERSTKSLSKEKAYILQKAQVDWKQDPLIQLLPKDTEKEEQGPPLVLDSKILYTGFLQMGDKRLAIISGIEYEIGDRLEPDGLIIQNIQPNHVVIASPDKKNKKVILPMEEIE